VEVGQDSGSIDGDMDDLFLKAQQDSIVNAFLDLIVTKGSKMREYLNSICKPRPNEGKCLMSISGIPARTLLCVRIGNKQQYQRFGSVGARCRVKHKDLNKVWDFPKYLPMLLEVDMCTTVQDIAEMVPLWMLRDKGVCKIEFSLILRPINGKSDIKEHHVLSMWNIRDNHLDNCALAVMNAAKSKKLAELKAKNTMTKERIKEIKKKQQCDRTQEEKLVKAMTRKEIETEVTKYGDIACGHFKSTTKMSSMVVVKNGMSRWVCCVCVCVCVCLCVCV